MSLCDTYDEFKVNIHSLFPCIYDTQFISCELQERIQQENTWESKDLEQLYQYFKDSNSVPANLNFPTIKLVDEFDESVSNVEMFKENAGHNKSFQVGYCFIRMMQILATHTNSISGGEAKHLRSEHLSAVKKFENCVYISLANISHMCLDSPDRKLDTYQWLLVRSAKEETVIDSLLLKEKCSGACTSVIVKNISKNQALVGTDSQAGMRRLFKLLSTNQSYIPIEYKCTGSDLTLHALMWSGALVCSGVGAWIILQLSRSKINV